MIAGQRLRVVHGPEHWEALAAAQRLTQFVPVVGKVDSKTGRIEKREG